jgi:hypothetical protein
VRPRPRTCYGPDVMRSLMMAMLLVACGSDPDPHELTTCVGWTINGGMPFEGMCEAACKMPPQNLGKRCDTTVQLSCSAFESSGVDGCCIPETDGPIKFVECVTVPK